MSTAREEHFCLDIDNFPIDKYFQKGVDKGKKMLIVGESPAENGWRKSGKAFYSPEGKLLATGRRLNELLSIFDLDVSKCGFTELSKCFIGNNRKILGNCCKKCWPIFEKQVNRGNFQLIISLGVIPAQIIGDILGEVIEMGVLKKVKVDDRQIKLLPIYHPSPANPFGREKNRKIFEKYKKQIRTIIFG